MELIANIFLIAGASGATFYCYILAQRLRRFNDLETGVGGAVAVLSAQVDDLTKTLESAQKSAGTAGETLKEMTDQAENVAKRLELMVASMHDLPPSNDAKFDTKTAFGPTFRRSHSAGVSQ